MTVKKSKTSVCFKIGKKLYICPSLDSWFPATSCLGQASAGGPVAGKTENLVKVKTVPLDFPMIENVTTLNSINSRKDSFIDSLCTGELDILQT